MRVFPKLKYQRHLLISLSRRALLNVELRHIFRDAKPNPTIIAPQSIRDAYNQATGSSSKSGEDASGETPSEKHKDPEGDDCAICYEPMKAKQSKLEKELVWCDTCDNVRSNLLYESVPLAELTVRPRHFTKSALVNVSIYTLRSPSGQAMMLF